jgi:hypothetical protein
MAGVAQWLPGLRRLAVAMSANIAPEADALLDALLPLDQLEVGPGLGNPICY